MVGLDVTHQVLAVPERMEQLKDIGTDVAQFVAELVEFFGASYMKERNYPGPPMHDPLAVAAVADPSLLRTVRAPIYVETQRSEEHTSELQSRGHLVCRLLLE